MSPGAVERSELQLPRARPGRHPARSAGRDDGKLKPITLPNGEKAENEPRRLAGDEVVGRRPGRVDPLDRRHAAAPRRARRSRARSSPARPARRRTTATPGSSAGPRRSRSPSGSAIRTSCAPMQTEFNGEPVAGGTYPAGDLEDVRGARARATRSTRPRRRKSPTSRSRRRRPRPRRPATPAPETPAPAPEDSPPTGEGGGTEPAPEAPAPAEPAPAEPAPEAPPAEQPPSDSGGGRAGVAAKPGHGRPAWRSERRPDDRRS